MACNSESNCHRNKIWKFRYHISIVGKIMLIHSTYYQKNSLESNIIIHDNFGRLYHSSVFISLLCKLNNLNYSIPLAQFFGVYAYNSCIFMIPFIHFSTRSTGSCHGSFQKPVNL